MVAHQVLEQRKRFSQSALWEVQRRFFEHQGPEAWSAGVVPHQVTCNPFIAQAYARIVLGFLRDCVAGGRVGSQPIHILELGSGSGRFALQFLRKLVPMVRRSGLRDVRFRYVMTDFAAANLAPWRDRPELAEWVAEGLLDFAQLDVGACDQVTLLESGTQLVPGGLDSPLVVISNYVFDGTPVDLFLARGGELHELAATLTADGGADVSDPDLLGRLGLALDASAPLPAAYYGDATLDHVLDGYRRRLGDTVLAFPTAALGCIRALERLAGGQLLLLSADKGYHLEEDLLERGMPEIALHGSFSLPVNYHAIGEVVRHLGGEVMTAPHRSVTLDICAFAFGGPEGGHGETRLAYEDAIEALGPDDLFTLRKSIEPGFTQLPVPALLALVRLCGSDPEVLFRCLPALRAQAATATPAAQQEIWRLIERAWAAYVPIGESRDLAFELGALLHEMGYLREAIGFFERSLDEHEPDAGTLFNLALCHVTLREPAAALRRIDEALALAPDMDEARTLRIRLGMGGRA